MHYNYLLLIYLISTVNIIDCICPVAVSCCICQDSSKFSHILVVLYHPQQ